MELGDLTQLERELTTRNLVGHAARYAQPPGTVSPSGVAVVGFAGHLFIADGANNWESQLDGRFALPESFSEDWVALLGQRVARAGELGVAVAHLIAPEKQVILPQFRWADQVPAAIGERPVSKILPVAPPEANLVYPADLFGECQNWCELFWRRNSHWCASACAIAALSVVEALVAGQTADFSLIRFERAMVGCDLQAHFTEAGAPIPYEELIRIRAAGAKVFDNELFKTGAHVGNRYILQNDEAPIPDAAVIFGDSYAFDAGLTAAFSAFFRETHFVWSKELLWDYVQDNAISYVVCETAERFLVTVPAE